MLPGLPVPRDIYYAQLQWIARVHEFGMVAAKQAALLGVVNSLAWGRRVFHSLRHVCMEGCLH